MTPVQHRHPVAATALLVATALVGMIAFVHLHAGLPSFLRYPAVQVSVRDPGFAASAMDRRIARPLLDDLARIHGLRDLRSRSTEGETAVTLVFKSDSRLDRAMPQLGALLAGNLALPASARHPELTRLAAPDRIAGDIMVTGKDQSLPALRIWTEDTLLPQFLGIGGIAGGRIEGGPVREIRVVPRQGRLARLGLAPGDVAEAVRIAQRQQHSGYLAAAAHSGPAAVAALPVRLPNGNILALSQVAVVRQVSRPGAEVRLDGRPAIRLVLRRARSRDPLAAAAAIRAHADWLRANGLLPAGVQLQVHSVLARYLSDLLHRFVVMAAVSLVLAVALVVRTAGSARDVALQPVAGLAALFGTGAVLAVTGSSLNAMDLSGLIVASGLCLAAPLSLCAYAPLAERPAITRALYAVLPVAIVLLALLAVPGPLRLLFRDFVVVVLSALCLSFILAVAVAGTVPGGGVRRTNAAGGCRLAGGCYRRWVVSGTGKPARAAAAWVATAGILAAVAALALRGMEFFPPPGTGEVLVRIRAVGTAGARNLKAQVPHILGIARSLGGVARVTSIMDAAPAGRLRLHVVFAGHPGAAEAEQWVQSFERSVRAIGLQHLRIRAVVAAFPGVRSSRRSTPVLGAMEGLAAVEVTGPAGPAPDGVGARVAEILSAFPQLRDVRLSSARTTAGLALHLDPVLAAEHGVDEMQAMRALRIARGGVVAGTLLEGEHRHAIRVVLPASAGRFAALPALLLRGETRTRRAVHLGDVATIARVSGPAEYLRDHGQPVVTVTGVLTAQGSADGTVDALRQRIAALSLPPGYRLSLGGVAAVTGEVAHEMAACGLGAVLTLLAALAWRHRGWRRPLIILLGALVPVAGALAALAVGEHTLSAPGWIGLVIGVATSAGLTSLAVDVLDSCRPAGPYRGALLAASALWAAPVVVQMGVPVLVGAILLGVAGGSAFAMLRPLALALAGGTAAGMAGCLLWTPLFYMILLGERRAARLQSGGQAPE